MIAHLEAEIARVAERIAELEAGIQPEAVLFEEGRLAGLEFALKLARAEER